jgi:hypothetical protein
MTEQYSSTFELLMRLYEEGETDQFVRLAQNCLREKLLSADEATTITKLLPHIKIKNLPDLNQVMCLLALNKPGIDLNTLCRDTGLSREQIVRAQEGKSWSMKVMDGLAGVLGLSLSS